MGRSGQRQASSTAVRRETPERNVVWATADDQCGVETPVAPPRELRYEGKTILVLCGVPGAGKSHLAKRLLSDISVLEADQFVKEREARGDMSADRYRLAVGDMLAQAQMMCMDETPVIVLDATAVSRRFRRFVLTKLAEKYGYAVDMIALDATPEECLEGQRSRGRVIEDEMQRVYESEWEGLKWRISRGILTSSRAPHHERFRSVVVLDRRSSALVERIEFA